MNESIRYESNEQVGGARYDADHGLVRHRTISLKYAERVDTFKRVTLVNESFFQFIANESIPLNESLR